MKGHNGVKTINRLLVIVCCALSLSACDVFYTARYYPFDESSATLNTPKPVDTATLVTAVEAFAAKWDLHCARNVPASAYGPAAELRCSGGVVVLSGNVAVVEQEGRPLIYFTGGEPGGLAFFSRTAYCKRLTDIQSELQKYTGPLKLQVETFSTAPNQQPICSSAAPVATPAAASAVH